jgi:hypothetical protein
MNIAPKYSKIELMVAHAQENGLSIPVDIINFYDCGMFISGNFMIIVEDCRDSSGVSNVSTEGTIFNLNEIKKYITYTQ